MFFLILRELSLSSPYNIPQKKIHHIVHIFLEVLGYVSSNALGYIYFYSIGNVHSESAFL